MCKVGEYGYGEIFLYPNEIKTIGEKAICTIVGRQNGKRKDLKRICKKPLTVYTSQAVKNNNVRDYTIPQDGIIIAILKGRYYTSGSMHQNEHEGRARIRLNSVLLYETPPKSNDINYLNFEVKKGDLIEIQNESIDNIGAEASFTYTSKAL